MERADEPGMAIRPFGSRLMPMLRKVTLAHVTDGEQGT